MFIYYYNILDNEVSMCDHKLNGRECEVRGVHAGPHMTYDEDGNIEDAWLSMSSDHIKTWMREEQEPEELWEYVEGI